MFKTFFGISSTPMQNVICNELSLIIIVKQSILHWFNMKNINSCYRKGLHHDLEIFHARCLGRFLVFPQHQCNLSHVAIPLESIRGIPRNLSWIIFFKIQFELNLNWFELTKTQFESIRMEFESIRMKSRKIKKNCFCLLGKKYYTKTSIILTVLNNCSRISLKSTGFSDNSIIIE